MVERNTDDEWRDIADRLQYEARQTRPVFSDSLHARICRAVEQDEMAEPLRPAAPQGLFRAGIAATVAATLAVGVLYLVWQGNFTGARPKPGDLAGAGGQEKDIVLPKPMPDEDSPSPTDVPANPAVDIGLLVDSTLTNRQWAYLDHDTQLAARMLLDQLPGSIAWPEEER
jgi:hypothetical protein